MPRISTDNYDTVASWNGSQDLFVVEQPDGTKVATPAMVKQYVLGNSIDDVYSVMGQMGAKNLIPYPYTNAYRTTEGVTITEGSIKGSCVFNGTSTGRVDAQLGYRSSNALTLLPSVQYCLSIKTDGSFAGNLAVEAWNKGTTTYAKSIARVTPSSTGSDYKEVIFSVTQSDINNYDFAVLIYGNSGNTFNNVTVYPMLRLAADTDNTYQPYAKTNKQLTDELDTAREQISGLNASKLTLVESKEISTGKTLTFDTQIQADTMYLIAMSAPVTATSRQMKCSMIKVVDTTTNEISFGNSNFVVTVNNLTVTITNNSILYGLRASLIKLE